jgi:hypothetical protein
MDNKQLLDLMKQAEKEGKDFSQVLSKIIEEERKLEGELVAVQIMPNHTIAGYGSFPWSGMMPIKKAIELAKYGKVSIMRDKEDLIDENDIETIRSVMEEGIEIRKSLERGKRRRKAERVNSVPPKVPFVLGDDLEEDDLMAEGIEEEEADLVEISHKRGPLEKKVQRYSRRGGKKKSHDQKDE